MIDPNTKKWSRHDHGAEAGTPALDPVVIDPELEARLAEEPPPHGWVDRAGRRGFREKLTAGLSGLKHAFRGDSSFFAHTYRGILIALTAALLGIGPLPWCFLVLAAALVFIAELAHSAVVTLARALGDPDEPGLRVAREIATAGVLVAVVTLAAVCAAVFTSRLGELLAWW